CTRRTSCRGAGVGGVTGERRGCRTRVACLSGWRPFCGAGRHRQDFVAIRAARPMPDVVPYYGREGMVQMLADWIDGFAEFQLTAEEFNDADERHVMVPIHQRAKRVKSG